MSEIASNKNTADAVADAASFDAEIASNENTQMLYKYFLKPIFFKRGTGKDLMVKLD